MILNYYVNVKRPGELKALAGLLSSLSKCFSDIDLVLNFIE